MFNNYIIEGEYVKLELKFKKQFIDYVIIDIEDLERLISFNNTWKVKLNYNNRVIRIEAIQKTYFSKNNIVSKTWTLSRYLLNVTDEDVIVSYKDGNLLNCKKDNLYIKDRKDLNKKTDRNKIVTTIDIQDGQEIAQEVELKQCTFCKQWKPLTEYYYANKRKGILHGDCKYCNRHTQNEYRNILKEEKKAKELEQIHLMQSIGAVEYHKIVLFTKKPLPSFCHYKEFYLTVIKHLIDTQQVSQVGQLIKQFKLIKLYDIFNPIELQEEIFIHNANIYFNFFKGCTKLIEYDDIIGQKQLFDRYLKVHNITITDIFKFNYVEAIAKSGLIAYIEDSLSFVVRYYDYQYPAYKFSSVSGKKYWQDADNLNRELQYFIEKDLQISIDNIPKVLTPQVLVKKSHKLYHNLRTKKVYQSLYEWINAIYPNKFTEQDFKQNYGFDSKAEIMIDKILRESFDNVLYNERNSINQIKLNNMIPDWFVFTPNGCIIIEYFGMYELKAKRDCGFIKPYREKTHKKISQYEDMKAYEYMFIYPSDLERNYEGLFKKISSLKGKVSNKSNMKSSD